MSLNPIDFALEYVARRLFVFAPVVDKRGNTLVARSDWHTHVFSLGAWSRSVVVDPVARTCRIRSRIFWIFVKSRRIEFEWCAEIQYDYAQLSPGTNLPTAYQQDDAYIVGLRLSNGEQVHLFRFCGSGDFVNDGIWPDWCYWSDDLLAQATKGNQETLSLAYADLLSAMIGVPIGNSPF